VATGAGGDVAERLSELLERCKQRDDRAVAVLVDRFRDSALGVAEAILGDAHLAEDAVQDAFLTAIQRLDDLRDSAAFPGWLRQIVRTQSCRIARRRRDASTPGTLVVPATAGSPLQDLVGDELRGKIREALRGLPDRNRRVAELYYLDDRPCDDVARMLDASPGTVKSRLHDARRRLRSMLLGYVEPEAAEPEERVPPGLPL